MKMETAIRSLADEKRATLAEGEPGLEIGSMRKGLFAHGLTHYSHHQNVSV